MRPFGTFRRESSYTTNLYREKDRQVGFMCERYSLASSLSDIEAYYQIDKMAFPFKSSYLLEPTQPVPVIVAEGGSRRLEHYRWGSSFLGAGFHQCGERNCGG